MRKGILNAAALAWCTAAALAGCYGSTSNHLVAMQSPPPGTSTPTPTPKPTQTPVPTPTPTGPTPTPTAQPQVIHIGFELAEHTDPKYGPVYFYSLTLDKQANVIMVKSGSQIVFLNDGTPATQHTGSGLGTSFPPSFDNSSGFTQSGSVIDGSTTWSTGTLNPGQMSQVFTVGAKGVYYFGCAYHYFQPPTPSNGSMGDVLVSM